MFANKYQIIEQLGNGKFGQVFKAVHKRSGEEVAIKIEMKNIDTYTNCLLTESKIYQYLKSNKCIGFPRLKWYGTTNDYNYLVMDYLGISLSSFLNINKCNIKTKIHICVQIIQRIHTLHLQFLLHRDIKPDNFLIHFISENQPFQVTLIDFGLAKRYEYDTIHIEMNNISSIIGSLNYISLNVHNKIEPSRRDDLESAIYVILYILYGKLPWFKPNCSEKQIISYKQQILKSNIHDNLKHIIHYIHKLSFEQTPNYIYLIEQLQEIHEL